LNPDYVDCTGTVKDWSASDQHFGWLADSAVEWGKARSELGTTTRISLTCYLYPVWCCSDGN